MEAAKPYKRYKCKRCGRRFNDKGSIPRHRLPAEQIGTALRAFQDGMSYAQVTAVMETQFGHAPSPQILRSWNQKAANDPVFSALVSKYVPIASEGIAYTGDDQRRITATAKGVRFLNGHVSHIIGRVWSQGTGLLYSVACRPGTPITAVGGLTEFMVGAIEPECAKCQTMRVTSSRRLFQEREARPPELLFKSSQDAGADLMREVDAAIPERISGLMRQDVMSDVLLALLSGTYSHTEMGNAVEHAIKAYSRLYTRSLSLNAIIAGTDDLTLSDRLVTVRPEIALCPRCEGTTELREEGVCNPCWNELDAMRLQHEAVVTTFSTGNGSKYGRTQTNVIDPAVVEMARDDGARSISDWHEWRRKGMHGATRKTRARLRRGDWKT